MKAGSRPAWRWRRTAASQLRPIGAFTCRPTSSSPAGLFCRDRQHSGWNQPDGLCGRWRPGYQRRTGQRPHRIGDGLIRIGLYCRFGQQSDSQGQLRRDDHYHSWQCKGGIFRRRRPGDCGLTPESARYRPGHGGESVHRRYRQPGHPQGEPARDHHNSGGKRPARQ